MVQSEGGDGRNLYYSPRQLIELLHCEGRVAGECPWNRQTNKKISYRIVELFEKAYQQTRPSPLDQGDLWIQCADDTGGLGYVNYESMEQSSLPGNSRRISKGQVAHQGTSATQ